MGHPVEHRGFHHGIMDHIPKNNTVTDPGFTSSVKGPIPIKIPGKTTISPHPPAFFAFSRLMSTQNNRFVWHFQTVRHVAGKRNIQHDGIYPSIINFIFNRSHQTTGIPGKRTSRLQDYPQMRITGPEITQDPDQFIFIVTGMRHQMPSTKINPFQQREKTPETLLHSL